MVLCVLALRRRSDLCDLAADAFVRASLVYTTHQSMECEIYTVAREYVKGSREQLNGASV